MSSDVALRSGRCAALLAAAALAVSIVSGIADGVAAQPKSETTTDKVTPVAVSARRLDSFRRGDSDTKRFGRLEFRGGLTMTSPDARFGGFSGLAIAPDGRRFLAISDEGNWLSGEITYAAHAPSGITNARMGPLLGLNGRPLRRKRDADAEELTLLSGTLSHGVALVAFERNHRLVRYPIIDGALGRPTALVRLPPESKRMSSNSGLEAVTVMRGGPYRGSILAFAEDLKDADGHQIGWLLGKGSPKQLAVKEMGGFALTGAASLEDGSILLLERRFRMTEGVKMRLRHIPAVELKPGHVIEGETLISSDMNYEIDNIEAVAVHKGAGGETIVTLISDDNFNKFLQRNLLLQFTLHPAAAKATSR
ncbi:MAG: esterase-like activity of phytase family protein [Hyphomicrobiaceae bacterium]